MNLEAIVQDLDAEIGRLEKLGRYLPVIQHHLNVGAGPCQVAPGCCAAEITFCAGKRVS